MHPDHVTIHIRDWEATRSFFLQVFDLQELLASQAEIARENKRLYRELAEREAKIRRLVDANIIDLTGRKRAEEALRNVQIELAHANRVAIMGQLAASIAHDVSQPIAATVIHAQAALRWLGAEPPNLERVRESLDNIIKGGHRARDVIGRTRSIIKKAPPRKDRLDINEPIREMIELTRGEAVKHGVSVQAELMDDLPLLEGDRVGLQQVILNLVMNAVEAMSSTSDGLRTLSISTGRAEQGGVLVVIGDSGPGLASAAVERLFDAFYTTKPGGLGLGLSICRSIIEAHGGQLWASPRAPHGTAFHFTVPIAVDV